MANKNEQNELHFSPTFSTDQYASDQQAPIYDLPLHVLKMLTNANKKGAATVVGFARNKDVGEKYVKSKNPPYKAKKNANFAKKAEMSKKFHCESCDYSTSKKSNFLRHISNTKKHTKKKVCPLCFKVYKHASSLSRHKTQCKGENIQDVEEEEPFAAELKKLLVRNNQLIEGKLQNEPTVVNNNLSINVFLNEYCKEALNLTDFIDNIRPTIEDLLKTHEMGYVGGITNIFLENLKDLPTVKRPIHCSDAKRLQFYVKDNEEWTKDEEGNKMKKAINKVTHKQIGTLKEWTEGNPAYLDHTSSVNGTWHQLINSTMGGHDDQQIERNQKKIKQQIAQETTIKEAINEL